MNSKKERKLVADDVELGVKPKYGYQLTEEYIIAYLKKNGTDADKKWYVDILNDDTYYHIINGTDKDGEKTATRLLNKIKVNSAIMKKFFPRSKTAPKTKDDFVADAKAKLGIID